MGKEYFVLLPFLGILSGVAIGVLTNWIDNYIGLRVWLGLLVGCIFFSFFFKNLLGAIRVPFMFFMALDFAWSSSTHIGNLNSGSIYWSLAEPFILAAPSQILTKVIFLLALTALWKTGQIKIET